MSLMCIVGSVIACAFARSLKWAWSGIVFVGAPTIAALVAVIVGTAVLVVVAIFSIHRAVAGSEFDAKLVTAGLLVGLLSWLESQSIAIAVSNVVLFAYAALVCAASEGKTQVIKRSIDEAPHRQVEHAFANKCWSAFGVVSIIVFGGAIMSFMRESPWSHVLLATEIFLTIHVAASAKFSIEGCEHALIGLLEGTKNF